ncbi:MAG TPA: family 78 glycoside hydrolase catalytic domain [Bacteroidota bacterium]|nr:family 78 glycoside hydrolase catalytic domain [Bacteroidota bacterium]
MRSILALLLVFAAAIADAQHLSVADLSCEYLKNPLGIDARAPRLSWKLASDQQNILQTAYALRVCEDSLGGKLLWESGQVRSDHSIQVPYGGPALMSGKRYVWQVRVWDNKGNVSPWSAAAWWEMGLLSPDDWKARWIESGLPEDTSGGPAIMIRKAFTLREHVASARLYVSAHGMYEISIDGHRVGDGYLAPGWTSYNKRLQYQVYDVSHQLNAGTNAIGATLGDGWYRGLIGFQGQKNFYGDKLGLLLQLAVVYADGSKDTLVSDRSWKASTGPIRMSEIYLGETYDARREQRGWEEPAFNDSGWTPVREVHFPMGNLIASCSPPVRKHEVFHPVSLTPRPDGSVIVDFGQNLVGWVDLRASGTSGDTVTIRHAEVLDRNGDLYTLNLRAATEEAKYVLNGAADEFFEPNFTFFGFRYAKISGYPGTLNPEKISAVALYSDLESTGTFTCSNPLVRQLYHNIRWGQKGNFLDVPTDCPQRDERLGWTGDAQAFSKTAMLNMDVAPFYTKWLADLAADQRGDGAVPHVIPTVLDSNSAGSAGWSDAATVVPWNVYLSYDDTRLLERQYRSMAAWVGFMEAHSTNYLWNTGWQYGDWLFYRPSDDNDGRSAVTDKYLIAQAYFAHSTQLLVDAALVLGRKNDAERYAKLLGNIRTAFQKEYLTPNGELVSPTQTAYVLALDFDLLPPALRAQAAQRLVKNIHSYGDHLTTGFLGTPHLCQVLTRFGYADVAYTLLLQKTYPSWLYPVTMGATTIWERWDGIRPDGTFQNPGMNSFNHYAYGAIGEWLIEAPGGIQLDPAHPGYKRFRIAPLAGGDLTSAAATLETMYGTVASSWEVSGDTMSFHAQIPPNTRADVALPDGGRTLSLGSGSYHFEYRVHRER